MAAKLSLSNELTKAIELLNKGLAINPNHFPCRFNHGVLMFKLGLINIAKHDFEVISNMYLKENMAHFNYSLSLFQLGHYQKAIDPLEMIVKDAHLALSFFQAKMKEKDQIKKGTELTSNFTSFANNQSFDFDLIYDSLMLKAQCYYRLFEVKDREIRSINTQLTKMKIFNEPKQEISKKNQKVTDIENTLVEMPLEFVQNFQFAQKFKNCKSNLEGKKPYVKTYDEMKVELKNLIQVETSDDIRQTVKFGSK